MSRKKHIIVSYIENCVEVFEDIVMNYDVVNAFMVYHDRDPEIEKGLRKPHYHIYLEFLNPKNPEFLAPKFNVSINQVLPGKSLFGYLQYCTHIKEDGKAIYYEHEFLQFGYEVKQNFRLIEADNAAAHKFSLILKYIDEQYAQNKPFSLKILTHWCLGNGLYSSLRSNYQIIKDYIK